MTVGTRIRSAKPMSGNSTNVAANTTECRRQCLSPCSASAGDRRAP